VCEYSRVNQPPGNAPPPDTIDAANAAANVDAVDVDDTLTFMRERPRLVGLAYRLLGSLTDAEDIVQEAWFRWASADRASIERPVAWLTTVVSRLGLDRLRSVQRARLDYVGPWLPEPIVDTRIGNDPEQSAELADSLTTAFLVMLEQLSPEERLVVLLVDVFGESFRTAATSIGRSEEACRQLATRARRKLRASPEQRRSTDAEQLAIATAFVGAVMSGDIEAVRAMLTPTSVLVSDGGPHRHAARRPVLGPERIARFVINIAKRVGPDLSFDPVWVNGRPGVLVSLRGIPYMVTAVDVIDGQIDRYWSFLNPDKLQSVGRQLELV
jgi:RNA polymerase sigma-70 factor (ECF subfamily)